jgi:spermidine synthase
MRFYEMNPEVVRLAKGEQAAFSFLADTRADTDVVLGDTRISLERELAAGTPQKFDVLAIDAFSSDSIPVHLLTREAMKIYLGHLRNDRSILAFHISNRSRPYLGVGGFG